MPTRKIDHGSVFLITSVTGTWLAVEMPRFPVKMFARYVGYAIQIGSSDPRDAFELLQHVRVVPDRVPVAEDQAVER